MERVARCLCGALSIRVKGDPIISLACNCTNCQRRTGSAFGAVTYFEADQVVEIDGAHKSFNFKVDSGNTNTTSFCPRCGSTVFFKTELFAGKTGIAAGCFNDPSIPEPTVAAWTKSKYNWMEFPDHWYSLEQQTPT